ncbi:MAG: UDP-N-acetylglucosamine 1-carboxyvinyltransferase, partial [Clostridia bacterium]|nr:UDP-N-acetylglucosamine 1-carboxyvinyltransferase [Clostridia bacterium]
VNAEVQGRVAKFTGVEKLVGNHVKATDLRGGAAMVIAALIAEGETYIREIYHIERGYEQLIDKLVGVGAVIDRKTVPDDFYDDKK